MIREKKFLDPETRSDIFKFLTLIVSKEPTKNNFHKENNNGKEINSKEKRRTS